jgi:hypothetical protein
MKNTLICTFLACILMFSAYSQEKVVSTLQKVDLIAIPKFNEKKHDFGTDYYILNRNTFAVKVKLALVDTANTRDGLTTNEITVESRERNYAGWIIQRNMNKETTWSLKWEVTRN